MIYIKSGNMKFTKITKRLIIMVFCVYFVKNIAFISSPFIEKLTNYPFTISLHEKLTYIPLENKLNLMYISYTIRKMYYNLALSQDTILKILEKIGLDNWSSIDYFNAFVLVTAFYALCTDMNIQYNKNMKKMKEVGIISNKKIYSSQVIFFIVYTMLFRDVENVF